jgi:hypothetical protein
MIHFEAFKDIKMSRDWLILNFIFLSSSVKVIIWKNADLIFSYLSDMKVTFDLLYGMMNHNLDDRFQSRSGFFLIDKMFL